MNNNIIGFLFILSLIALTLILTKRELVIDVTLDVLNKLHIQLYNANDYKSVLELEIEYRKYLQTRSWLTKRNRKFIHKTGVIESAIDILKNRLK
ncbi:MAG: hypothetical protein ACOCVF_02260 [bacterium]